VRAAQKSKAKSSKPVEVGKPGINKSSRSSQSDVVDLAARDTLANARARLAVSGLLGVGLGHQPAHDINGSNIASAILSWSGASAQQTDHEGGLPIDVRGRYATWGIEDNVVSHMKSYSYEKENSNVKLIFMYRQQ
jgi:hypothetical protein